MNVIIRVFLKRRQRKYEVGDVMLKGRGWNNLRKRAQGKEGRKPLVSTRCKEIVSSLEPPEEASTLDTLTLAQQINSNFCPPEL